MVADVVEVVVAGTVVVVIVVSIDPLVCVVVDETMELEDKVV
jgi:hypothetical protein